MTVQVSMWPENPTKVASGEYLVSVGSFDAERDRNDICRSPCAGGSAGICWVVSPQLEAETAERVMASAATSGDLQAASALLTASNMEPTGHRSDLRQIADWESEGGTTQRRHETRSTNP